MIKNRNIAIDAAIDPSKIVNLGMGEVFYVAERGSAAHQWLDKRVPSDHLFDHVSTSSAVTVNGLKNAVAACSSGRNDYVVVMPSTSTYYIDELLSLSKVGMHLIGASNNATDYGSKNNIRIQQIGSALAIMEITAGGIEVAGLYLKNISTYAHITVPTTSTVSAWGLNIHHNTFVSRSSTTSLPMLDCNGDGAAYSEISYNWFQSQVTGGSFTAGVIDVEAAAAKTTVAHNLIQAADNTYAYGIRNKSAHSLVAYNVITEDLGTVEVAISVAAGCSIIGNRCAVATDHFSDGSATTGVGYADNMDGVTEGTGGITAQLET